MTKLEIALLSGGFGVVGALLGSVSGYALSRRGTRDDREYAEKQRVRERQEEAAQQLSRALIDAGDDVQTHIVPPALAQERLERARRAINLAWYRADLISDLSIDRAYWAFDNLLHMAIEDCRGAAQAHYGRDFSPLGPAYEDLRRALRAFLQHEPFDHTQFRMPDTGTLTKIAYRSGEPHGFEAIRRHVASDPTIL